MSNEVRYVVEEYAATWLHLTARVKALDEKIASQAENDGALEGIYRSVPGIGATSARVLANELGDTSQFQNEGQLFKYVGLTPTEHSSGEHVRQGHISRQGKPIIRKMLVQASWKAIKIDPDLQRTKNHRSFRMISAIANSNTTFTKPSTATCFSKVAKAAKISSSLAVPIIAALALSKLPTVSADRFTDCIDGCDRIEHELMKLICYAWCAMFAR